MFGIDSRLICNIWCLRSCSARIGILLLGVLGIHQFRVGMNGSSLLGGSSDLLVQQRVRPRKRFRCILRVRISLRSRGCPSGAGVASRLLTLHDSLFQSWHDLVCFRHCAYRLNSGFRYGDVSYDMHMFEVLVQPSDGPPIICSRKCVCQVEILSWQVHQVDIVLL